MTSCSRVSRRLRAVASAAVLLAAVIGLWGCDPVEEEHCVPRGTVYGGGTVEISILPADGDWIDLESTGIEEGLLGSGDVGDFEYDDATMGEASAFLWSFPDSSTVEAHFEWSAPVGVGESSCAGLAHALVLLIEFDHEPDDGGEVYTVTTSVLSVDDDLVVESSVDLPDGQGALDSPREGTIEATADSFPHLTDCLGGPSAVPPTAPVTIRWVFDEDTHVDLCRPLGLD